MWKKIHKTVPYLKKILITPANRYNHYIVAIGASAGGLEAIHEFFDSMPETPYTSFIIIQHLSPDYKSLLVELVARHTEMNVYEAADLQEIERKCIYVIPNTKLITIQKNKLRLTEKKNGKLPNNAVDVFLYSLARERKDKAIAVILSGTGTDGTKGTEAIKKEGGLVIVQDPSTARFDGMPNSVIAAGNADYVLPPAAIYSEIMHYISPPPPYLYGNDKKDDQFLKTVFDLIHGQSGVEFHYYKTPTILRRINKRMMQGSFSSPDKYITYLQENKDEVSHLGQDFLIGVTHFFRDPEAFGILRDKVVPTIIDGKEEDDIIKVWVTACSTGEEAYSIAIVIDEVLEKTTKNLAVKIFASDIDTEAIQFASAGEYPLSIEKDVDARLLKKYFTRNGKTYTIAPRIRKQIVFAKHNIIKDPPFIKNDLISCRNMLIYISPSMQQRIFSLLLFAAGKDGYIFLGPTENSSLIKKDVQEISARWKVYRKTGDSKPAYYFQQTPVETYPNRRERPGQTNLLSKESRGQAALWEDFKQVLMDDLSYVTLYIDANFEIREIIGPYEKFLTLPRRQLHLNLLRMVPSPISILLSAEIRKAGKTGAKVHLRNVRYRKGETMVTLEIFIRAVGETNGLPSTNANTTMIVFRELSVEEIPADPGNGHSNGHNNGSSHSNGNGHSDHHNLQEEYVRALEAELGETKNQLQLTVEDLEATNEELQATNEELLSANEELQSSNEELQSLNEELITLNTEHQLKIKELLELNDDLNNYFRSTDIAQVFLDAQLRIRKFNPASSRMINFIDTDAGRPITHISNNIRSESLLNDVQTVLSSGTSLEKEVQLAGGKDLLMRITPYLTHDGHMDGVIISFVDIRELVSTRETLKKLNTHLQDKVKEGSLALALSEERFRLVSRATNDAIWDWDLVNNSVWWSDAFYKQYGYEHPTPGLDRNSWLQKIHPQDQSATTNSIYAAINTHQSQWTGEYRFRREDGWYADVLDRAYILYDDNGTAFRMLGSMLDVTELKKTQYDLARAKEALEEKVAERTAQLKQLNEALETSNHDLQQFASIASHDLQEPLRKIHMFSKAIQDRFDNQLPEDIKVYFAKIIRSTDRMRALVIDILNFSRLSAENTYFRRTDLKMMYAEILEDFEIIIREKQATVTAGELPEIDLIPGQFRQVLHNLLSNALKFTRPGNPPVIHLEATCIGEKSFAAAPDPAGAFYRFSITDNGIGFEEKNAENVFKLFQRLHPKDRFEGTGIGLAITKKIIERHNGLITAHSSQDQGARFDFILPATH